MAVAKVAGFSRKEVERVLARVLRSEQFAGSQQLSEFLTFIVSKTLDGEQDQIKAYTIAVDALGRSEDFDPQTNAAVRVAAGRLRQALALHNTSEGAVGDNLKIVLEPGSYIPTFETLKTDESEATDSEDSAVGEEVSPQSKSIAGTAAPTNELPRTSVVERESIETMSWIRKFWPVLAIATAIALALLFFNALRNDPPARQPTAKEKMSSPFDARPSIMTTILLPDAPYPDWFKTGEASDAITDAIARFDDYRSIGTYSSEEFPLNDQRVADYHLLGTVYRRGNNVRFYGKMIRERDGTIVWSIQRLFTPPLDGTGRNLPEIAGSALSEVGSPYGVIYSDLLKTGDKTGKLACVIATYQYFNRKTTEGHLKARDCAEAQIAAGSTSSSVYASLAFLYLDERRENRNPRERDPLKAADRVATRAVQLGPTSARAYQALFAVHKVQGHIEEALKAAERAILLNPYDTDIIGDYGAWLISIGRLKAGSAMLQRAQDLLTAPPAWQEAYRFLAVELAGNSVRADAIAESMDPTRSPFTAMAVIISTARTGKLAARDAAIAELKKSDASLASFPRNDLIKRGFSEEIAQRIAAKLKASGL